MKRCKIAALYAIINKRTGGYYVGSSKDIRARFNRHKRTLELGTHHNSHLQNAWNKEVDKSVFDFVILYEPTDIDCLRILEDKLLEMTINNPYAYNICESATHPFIASKGYIRSSNKGKSLLQETKNKISKRIRFLDETNSRNLKYGEENGGSKLTWKQINEIRKLYNFGFTRKQLAEKFSITAANIWCIVTNRTWIDSSYIPRKNDIRTLTKDIIKTIMMDFTNGISRKEISNKYSIPYPTITQLIRRLKNESTAITNSRENIFGQNNTISSITEN